MRFSIFLILLIYSGICLSADILTKIHVLEDLNHLLDGGSIRDVERFSNPRCNREVVELVLLFQALDKGGYSDDIEIKVKETPYLRGKKIISRGDYTVLGDSSWTAEDSEGFWVTNPVIKDGEYIVGAYTSPENIEALAVRTQEQLKKLSAISSSTFPIDWKVLSNMDLAELYDINIWRTMVVLVAEQRADFLLLPFQRGPGLSVEYTNNSPDAAIRTVSLIPIPEVKVLIPGTRRWIVSKNNPHGKKAFDAIQAGLEILDRSGKRKRAFEECGFMPPLTKRWALMN